jgi:antirestriction protein ArdC
MHANDLFDQITAQLIADIETGAARDWRMPCHTLADAGTPTNVDGRPYRGMNSLWLPMVAASQGWTIGLWATYRGWQRHGAQVRRGEKAAQVILWKPTAAKSDDTATGDDQPGPRRRLLARAYAVFAAEQVDGAADILAARAEQTTGRDTPERVEAAEAFFVAVGATVLEGGNQAGYRPATDTIVVPTLAQFDHAAGYYATLAHEHVHWTAHPSRLARDLTGRFGDDRYGAEELVAELGAAMWCAQHGISAVTRPDHAAYLASWLRILRTDTRALLTASSKAQAAVDHLNGIAGITTDASEASDGAAA